MSPEIDLDAWRSSADEILIKTREEIAVLKHTHPAISKMLPSISTLEITMPGENSSSPFSLP
jgi:hypothetical protein